MGRIIGRSSTVLMIGLFAGSCAYTPKTEVDPASNVGNTGGIAYNHQKLSGANHLVTVSVKPGLLETETSMSERQYIFANKFAAQTCPRGFDFLNNPNTGQPVEAGFAQRTKTYSFACR